MARWAAPDRGAPADPILTRRPERRAVLLGRSAAAPVLLALTTVAAVASAVLALLPAAVRARPAGRAGPEGAAEEGAPAAAREPLAR